MSQHHEVIALDVVKEKVDLVNKRISPIVDAKITEFFETKILNLQDTLDKKHAYKNSDYVVIATPTDYDIESNLFDTSLIETVIEDVLNGKKDLPHLKSNYYTLDDWSANYNDLLEDTKQLLQKNN